MRYTVRFDTTADRWYTEDESGHRCSLHCGETFLILVDKTFIMARLEVDSEWYVIIRDTKFWLHRNATYTIEYLF